MEVGAPGRDLEFLQLRADPWITALEKERGYLRGGSDSRHTQA